MSAAWRTVRVFISSTFRDMHAERDHLVKVVFPALRERLEKYRIYLDDIDLRWGVTKEQAENDQVLDLCLQQIDECRPFFVGILGERYGWVPTHFPADALKKHGWIQHHTGKSVTELEILHGVLQNPQVRGHAFFYFRDPSALQAVPEAQRHLVYAETDEALIEKLAELKKRIQSGGHPVMENYPARWDADAYDRPSRSRGRLVGLDAFGERVRDQLWQAIQEEFQLPEQPAVGTAADPLAEEQDYHERFMESRLRVYVGREQINDALFAFADGNDLVPCLVTGASGSGKSAALARFIRDYQHKQLQTLVIPHFIGGSPRSTNLRDMLRRFCQVFKARFGFPEEVPEETARLSVTFREFVGMVPTDTRLLLVIDALNQLDEADRAQELYWLPRELPPHVKVVVSCIADSGKTEPALEAFRSRKHYPVELAALSDAERRLIIREVPSLSAKSLDDDQVRLLLSNPATANPLFLLVALEELRGFGSYDQLNDRIGSFPCGHRPGLFVRLLRWLGLYSAPAGQPDYVTALFTQVIKRLAEEFNQKLVETVLTLLASARRGLSERELQELVTGLDGADDLFPVLRQLRPYLLSRAGLIDFYHRNLFKAVRERYLPSEAQQRQAHGRLAEYFQAQDYWLESLEEQRRRARALPPTPRPSNVRKVDELPWQLLQAADWQSSEHLLTDLAFLEAKAEAGMVFDLAADFSAAIKGMPADRPQLRILRLLEEALRRDVHFIARHAQDYPQGLFQCLWNSCWWYDSPEAAAHYDLSRRTGKGPLPWELPEEERLSPILNRWLTERACLVPDFRWLRSHRPPMVQLGTGQKAVFRGHENAVCTVAWSGNRIASGSADKTVRIWDSHSCEQIICCRGHEEWVSSVAWSPDGHRLASGSGDKTVRIWDVVTGQPLLCLPAHEDCVTSVAWSANSQHVLSWSADESIRTWCIATGLEAPPGHDDGSIVNWSGERKAWSNKGNCIASVFGGSILVWDATTNKQVLFLQGKSQDELDQFDPSSESEEEFLARPGHDGILRAVAWSADDSHLVTGSDDTTVRVWSVATGQEVRCLRGHEYGVTSVAVSGDGRAIVSGSSDGTLRIWTTLTEMEPLPLLGPPGGVTSLTWSDDGRRLVSEHSGPSVGSKWVWDPSTGLNLFYISGFTYVTKIVCCGDARYFVAVRNQKVHIWDGETGREIRYMKGDYGDVSCLSLSSDGRRIAGGSCDQLIYVWDAETGEILHCLTGPEGEVLKVGWSRDGRRILSETPSTHGNIICVWDSEMGECLERKKLESANEGTGAGSEQLPLVSVENLDTLIQDPGTQRELGWLPGNVRNIARHPSDQVWAGFQGDYVCIFTLEGNTSPTS